MPQLGRPPEGAAIWTLQDGDGEVSAFLVEGLRYTVEWLGSKRGYKSFSKWHLMQRE